MWMPRFSVARWCSKVAAAAAIAIHKIHTQRGRWRWRWRWWKKLCRQWVFDARWRQRYMRQTPRTDVLSINLDQCMRRRKDCLWTAFLGSLKRATHNKRDVSRNTVCVCGFHGSMSSAYCVRRLAMACMCKNVMAKRECILMSFGYQMLFIDKCAQCASYYIVHGQRLRYVLHFGSIYVNKLLMTDLNSDWQSLCVWKGGLCLCSNFVYSNEFTSHVSIQCCRAFIPNRIRVLWCSCSNMGLT